MILIRVTASACVCVRTLKSNCEAYGFLKKAVASREEGKNRKGRGGKVGADLKRTPPAGFSDRRFRAKLSKAMIDTVWASPSPNKL